MGHIKEPNGIDFVIKSRPLTKEEEIAISDYIQIYKAKHPAKQASGNKEGKRKKITA